MIKGLIVVDVQPYYYRFFQFKLRKMASFVQKQNLPTIFLFNDIEMGIEDDLSNLWDMFHGNGVSAQKLDESKFLGKTYGFFRTAMDSGNFSKEEMVEMAQSLLSSDLNAELLEQIGMYYPSFDIEKLTLFDEVLLIGGGRHECLEEIDILLQAMNVKTTIVEELTY